MTGVVSVSEKAGHTRQVSAGKTNVSEPVVWTRTLQFESEGPTLMPCAARLLRVVHSYIVEMVEQSGEPLLLSFPLLLSAHRPTPGTCITARQEFDALVRLPLIGLKA